MFSNKWAVKCFTLAGARTTQATHVCVLAILLPLYCGPALAGPFGQVKRHKRVNDLEVAFNTNKKKKNKECSQFLCGSCSRRLKCFPTPSGSVFIADLGLACRVLYWPTPWPAFGHGFYQFNVACLFWHRETAIWLFFYGQFLICLHTSLGVRGEQSLSFIAACQWELEFVRPSFRPIFYPS